MRVALVTWGLAKAGGAESYLETIAKPLAQRCDLAILAEIGGSPGNAISLPEAAPVWTVSQIGKERALDCLRSWRPDVIYCHGLLDPDLEARLLYIAPGVFFAHAYYGSCISGTKTVRFPRRHTCTRRFGWQCLVQYYPRRCGGLNPFEMWKLYQQQADRLSLLRRYKMILTASEFMRREYLNLGFAENTIVKLSYPLRSQSPRLTNGEDIPLERDQESVATGSKPWRLLFAGRMTRLKGGRELLKSLPKVARTVLRPLQLTMVGDGPERNEWQELAKALTAANSELRVDFIGWLPTEKLDCLFEETDLLVVPSIWPEPFGLIGLEAARRGVPQVGFQVGGISEWLQDGKSGYLASIPGSSQALAEAIIKCLSNPQVYSRLRRGSIEATRGLDTQEHLGKLLGLLSMPASALDLTSRPELGF